MVEHIFEWLSREWPRERRHPGPTIAEDGMSLADIANEIGTHAASADAWLEKILKEHVPAILAVAGKYQNSPVIQALEAAALPPEVEQHVAGIIAALARQFPAAPAPAQDPAQPQQ